MVMNVVKDRKDKGIVVEDMPLKESPTPVLIKDERSEDSVHDSRSPDTVFFFT
jgi:hypothetical protein